MSILAQLIVAALVEEVGAAVVIAPDVLRHPLLDGLHPAPARMVIGDRAGKGRCFEAESFSLPWVETVPELDPADRDAQRLTASRFCLLDVTGVDPKKAIERFQKLAGRAPDAVLGRPGALAATTPEIIRYRQLWVEADHSLALTVRPDLATPNAEGLVERILDERPCGCAAWLERLAGRSRRLASFALRRDTMTFHLPPAPSLLAFRPVDRARIGVSGMAYLPAGGEFSVRVPVIANRRNLLTLLFSNILARIDGVEVTAPGGEHVASLVVSYIDRGGEMEVALTPGRDQSTVDLQIACPPEAMGDPSAFLSELSVTADLAESEAAPMRSPLREVS